MLDLKQSINELINTVQAKQRVDRIDGAKAAELTQKVGKHASGVQTKGPSPQEGAAQKPEVTTAGGVYFYLG